MEDLMILAILQARVSSTRLPGKVLRPILGKPMLQHEIERVLRARQINKLVVATSISPDDDKIEDLCKKIGLSCFRGSLDDVLDRFYQAARVYKPDHVVRISGDCPLMDPKLIDEMVAFYLEQNCDYLCNTMEPTYPDGLDLWVFKFSALERAWKEARLPSEREHVLPYIRTHKELFNVISYKGKRDLSKYRWTVDEPNDFEFISRVYEALYPQNAEFSTDDVLDLLNANKELEGINMAYERDEGFKRSLLQDKITSGFKAPNIQTSLAMQDRARKRIPGMTQLLSKRPDQFSQGVWPGYYSKAKGAEIWDLDGNRYIDMSIGGIGANILGYADDDVDNAVKSAITNGSSSSLNCAEEVELADTLCELHPWAQKARFARSGGEAMVIAVRIARAFTGKEKLAFCGYHGWHDWYLSANIGTENTLGEHLLPGLSPAGVPLGLAGTMLPFRYNNRAEFEKVISQHGNSIAAIVMEPIRNDRPENNFLGLIREAASRIGAVLIFDEVSAAFRMNTGGSHLMFNVSPDIAVFSKALGNGYPVAAIIGKDDVMDAAQKTFISSTNWTERIGPAAALATIRKHAQFKVGEHVMRIGQQIQDGWKNTADSHGIAIHVGGIPPLSHFDFKEDHLTLKALFVQLMLDRGFLASNIFYAMYAHKDWHVKAYLEAVNDSFRNIAALKKQGKALAALRGKPAATGFKRLI